MARLQMYAIGRDLKPIRYRRLQLINEYRFV